MRLSEAMRLGAMIRPQSTDGFLFSGTGSCALGAALEAIGVDCMDFDSYGYVKADKIWPMLTRELPRCPVADHTCGGVSELYLGRMIWHLNDRHKWTREAIADWIEQTFEQPEAAKQDEGVLVAAVEAE